LKAHAQAQLSTLGTALSGAVDEELRRSAEFEFAVFLGCEN
jgi:hypothetical protein